MPPARSLHRCSFKGLPCARQGTRASLVLTPAHTNSQDLGLHYGMGEAMKVKERAGGWSGGGGGGAAGQQQATPPSAADFADLFCRFVGFLNFVVVNLVPQKNLIIRGQ